MFFTLRAATAPVNISLCVSLLPPFAFLPTLRRFQCPCSPGALLLLRHHLISLCACAGPFHRSTPQPSSFSARCQHERTIWSTSCLVVSMLDLCRHPCLGPFQRGLRHRPRRSQRGAGMVLPYVCRPSPPMPGFSVTAAMPLLASLPVSVFISAASPPSQPHPVCMVVTASSWF